MHTPTLLDKYLSYEYIYIYVYVYIYIERETERQRDRERQRERKRAITVKKTTYLDEKYFRLTSLS